MNNVDVMVIQQLRAFVAQKRREVAIAHFAAPNSVADLARTDPAAYRKTAHYNVLMGLADDTAKTSLDEGTEADKLLIFAREMAGEA